MKTIRYITIIIFMLILFLPFVGFNTEKESVSEIDNRNLAENPFSTEERESSIVPADEIDAYVSDRIGFRDDLILANTVINDRLFGIMSHPTYMYGQDGYIFINDTTPQEYGEFHEAFGSFILSMQEYCLSRGIPFVFVLEPYKHTALKEYLPKGMTYDTSWIDSFISDMEAKDINFVDNVDYLIEKQEEGIDVFNRKYDAGHWNDFGAFYGVNNIVHALQSYYPPLEMNQLSDFTVSESIAESLPVSKFPINETIPHLIPINTDIRNVTSSYDEEVERDYQYRGFGYYENDSKKSVGAPRTLVFQGSYMNMYGAKFLENAFGEYIFVHSYHNVLNFPYYIQLFQPDCVIFEVTEYTFDDGYFSIDGMKDFECNPVLDMNSESFISADHVVLENNDFVMEKSEHFISCRVLIEADAEHVWIALGDEVFDMFSTDSGDGMYGVKIPLESVPADCTVRIIAESSNEYKVYDFT